MGSLNESGVNVELRPSISLRVEPAEDSWHLANEHRGARLFFQLIQGDCCYGESMYRLLLWQDHRSVNQKRQMEPSPIMRSQQSLLLYNWQRQKTMDRNQYNNTEPTFNKTGKWGCLVWSQIMPVWGTVHGCHEHRWADMCHYVHHVNVLLCILVFES